MMLVASTISVSAVPITDPTNVLNQTPGFEIILFLVAIGIVILALIVYRGYKKRKKTLGYEYPAHEKGKLK
jgi:hypothetical protein